MFTLAYKLNLEFFRVFFLNILCRLLNTLILQFLSIQQLPWITLAIRCYLCLCSLPGADGIFFKQLCCFSMWESWRVAVGNYSSALHPIPSSHLLFMSRGEIQALLKSCHRGQLSEGSFCAAPSLQPAAAGTWRWLGACRELSGEVVRARWPRLSTDMAWKQVAHSTLKQALLSPYWVPLHKPALAVLQLTCVSTSTSSGKDFRAAGSLGLPWQHCQEKQSYLL